MTEQNNEQVVSTEVSNSNGNGGNSKKILIGVVVLALIAAIVFFVNRSSGIKTTADLLKVYAATVKRAEKQVEYQQEIQKKIWTKPSDSKLTMALNELPQGTLPFANAQLEFGLKNDPDNKRMQFSLDTDLGGKKLLSAKGELNENELLIDLGEYSEKMLAFPTKEFGAKLKEFNEKQGNGNAAVDEAMDISYSKMIGKFNITATETPKEYKEAWSALTEGVKVEKVEDGYQMILPNENVRAGIKKIFEAMKSDPRLAGMDATQNREEVFNNAIQSLEESTDEVTLEIFTKVTDGIASEIKVRALKNGEEELQSVFTIIDTKNVLNDWNWVIKSAKEEELNVTVTGKGVISKENTDYAVNVSASNQMSLSLSFAYGNPETSGDMNVKAKMMVAGEETMSFTLSGKYSNENGVQKFTSDVGELRVQNGMSEEPSEVKFSLESESKDKVEEFYTFDKEKYSLFDATKEENDEFMQAIMGMVFMKMMGM